MDSLNIIDTVNFKHYKSNGGNVAKNRVEQFKRRALAPDGSGEVIIKSQFGKYTDRLATLG